MPPRSSPQNPTKPVSAIQKFTSFNTVETKKLVLELTKRKKKLEYRLTELEIVDIPFIKAIIEKKGILENETNLENEKDPENEKNYLNNLKDLEDGVCLVKKALELTDEMIKNLEKNHLLSYRYDKSFKLSVFESN